MYQEEQDGRSLKGGVPWLQILQDHISDMEHKLISLEEKKKDKNQLFLFSLGFFLCRSIIGV